MLTKYMYFTEQALFPMCHPILNYHQHQFESLALNLDIAVLILVFNAAKNSPTMPTLLPDHTLRHYMYIRDTLPEHVPSLRVRYSTHKIYMYVLGLF